jgi:hypothetical protein
MKPLVFFAISSFICFQVSPLSFQKHLLATDFHRLSGHLQEDASRLFWTEFPEAPVSHRFLISQKAVPRGID